MQHLCKKCRALTESSTCPTCGATPLDAPAPSDTVFLIARKSVFAGMIADILEQNEIPFLKEGTQGSAITIQLGELTETYRFYVPYRCYKVALDLVSDITD